MKNNIPNNTLESLFEERIHQNAKRYFPELITSSISVQLRGKEVRPSAILYRYKVNDDTKTYPVIIKVLVRDPARDKAKRSLHEKPSLFLKADTQEMHWLQYTALTSIYDYFAQLNNEHLGAVQVLDYLPQYQAVFMEESANPSLQKLLLREKRFQDLFTGRDLTPAFYYAGKWLQEYQKMPKESGVQTRHQNKDDYKEAIVMLTDFLARTWGDKPFFKQTASVIVRNGEDVLPDLLPLGLGHGDYALRNILVSSDARVTVLDTFSKWRVPIYEDIGYFLNSLRTSYFQVLSQGLLFSSSRFEAYESAFLNGYFGSGCIPYLNVRLYEILALLDKWSYLVSLYHKKSTRLRFFGGAKALLASRYFKNRTKILLGQLTGKEKGSAFSAMRNSFE